MARVSVKEVVLNLLNEMGMNIDESAIEEAIKSIKGSKKTASFDDYFNGDTENYRIAYNKETPFAVLQSLYYSNPDLFRQVFKLVRVRSKRQA